MAGCRGFTGPFPLPLSMSSTQGRQLSQNVHIATTMRDGASQGENAAVQPWQVRRVLNAVNGSTALGLAVAAAGRARICRGPRGLLLATEFALPFPARAFTLGDVVVTGADLTWLQARPRLLRHEERHTWQYVACLGLPMLPLYLLASGWSLLRGGDPGVHNVFERLAGLADGGYPTLSARARRRLRTA